MPPVTSTRRRVLTQSQRDEILNFHKRHPLVTHGQIASIFGVERSTASKILSNAAGSSLDSFGSSSWGYEYAGGLPPPAPRHRDSLDVTALYPEAQGMTPQQSPQAMPQQYPVMMDTPTGYSYDTTGQFQRYGSISSDASYDSSPEIFFRDPFQGAGPSGYQTSSPDHSMAALQTILNSIGNGTGGGLSPMDQLCVDHLSKRVARISRSQSSTSVSSTGSMSSANPMAMRAGYMV